MEAITKIANNWKLVGGLTLVVFLLLVGIAYSQGNSVNVVNPGFGNEKFDILLPINNCACYAIPPNEILRVEVYSDEYYNDTETILYPLGASPWWFDMHNWTVTPAGGELMNSVFTGISYRATMKVNETGINKEVLFRVRIDFPDDTTYYTMWAEVETDTWETVGYNERISNVINDGRWATGNHDIGMVMDQLYYNITTEFMVSNTVTANITNVSVNVYYETSTPV